MFKFEVIDTASSREELDEKEIYWIAYYNSTHRDKGYNRDSGGHKGGVKSEETKRLIGKTTKEKWNNPEIASKMREGLNKATETWIQQCYENRVEFKCPICGRVILLPK